MATLYGNEYNDAYVSVPSVKIKPGYWKGQELVMAFTFDVTAAPTNGDVIKLGKLPKGALVTDAVLSFTDLGTAGVLNLGWAASSDGVVAADADGFLASVDVNAAAATVGIIEQANMPGLLKKFDSEVDVQIDVATAWNATSGAIKGFIKFVVV